MATPVVVKKRLLVKSHGTPTSGEKLSIRNALVDDLFRCGRGSQGIRADECSDEELLVRDLIHNANYAMIKLAQLLAKCEAVHAFVLRYLSEEMVSMLTQEGQKVISESDAAIHLLAEASLFVGLTRQLDVVDHSLDERIEMALQTIYRTLME